MSQLVHQIQIGNHIEFAGEMFLGQIFVKEKLKGLSGRRLKRLYKWKFKAKGDGQIKKISLSDGKKFETISDAIEAAENYLDNFMVWA